MKAMILAAGRGERMRPLTDTLPKPLLPVGDSTLIERHLHALAKAGFHEVVINLRHLGEMIEAKLGDGAAYGLRIAYSKETEALDTGGGVKQALPRLGEEPFALVSADVHTDMDYALLREPLPPGSLGRLVLVDNPSHNPQGDFGLDAEACLTQAPPRLTYSGLALIHPALIRQEPAKRFPLKQALDQAIAQECLQGQRYTGDWQDIGAPERYQALLAQEK